MKRRKMTPEEIAHFEKQKEKEFEDYTPPTEQEIKDYHDQQKQDYYVSDMTAEEEEAFEKEAHESYNQYLIEEEERKERFEKFAEKGIKFSKGKLLGVKSKSTVHIEELVKNNPNLKAKELFKLANPQLIGKMSLRTFQNHVSKIKNSLK